MTGHPALCLGPKRRDGTNDPMGPMGPQWRGKQLSHVVCCDMSPKMIRHHETRLTERCTPKIGMPYFFQHQQFENSDSQHFLNRKEFLTDD